MTILEGQLRVTPKPLYGPKGQGNFMNPFAHTPSSITSHLRLVSS